MPPVDSFVGATAMRMLLLLCVGNFALLGNSARVPHPPEALQLGCKVCGRRLS